MKYPKARVLKSILCSSLDHKQIQNNQLAQLISSNLTLLIYVSMMYRK